MQGSGPPNFMSPKQKAAIVDEYGEICRKIDEAETRLDEARQRAAELEAEILTWCEGQPAADAVLFEGKTFIAKVSARSLKRTIVDLGKVYGMFGKDKFLSFCSFPLGVIDKLLQPSEIEQLVKSERIGRRTVTVIAKA